MTPDAEQSMRSQLADYSKTEMIDLAISLQDVIDDHIHEKRGLQSSIEAMGIQIPALQAQVAQLESGPQASAEDLDELEQLRGENRKIRQKMEELRDRFDRVQALNEKFQEKLLDSV